MTYTQQGRKAPAERGDDMMKNTFTVTQDGGRSHEIYGEKSGRYYMMRFAYSEKFGYEIHQRTFRISKQRYEAEKARAQA